MPKYKLNRKFRKMEDKLFKALFVRHTDAVTFDGDE